MAKNSLYPYDDIPLEGGDWTPEKDDPFPFYPLAGLAGPMGTMGPVLPLWINPWSDESKEDEDPNP